MLERPADGSIKPPRVIAPAKPGVVLNEARGGVLNGMRIEFLGVRCVCEFVDQLFEPVNKLLPLLVAQTGVLVLDEPVINQPPEALFGLCMANS